MLFILTYLHIYWRFTILQTQTQIWWNYSQKVQLRKRKRDIQAKENKEGPSNLHIWAKHHQNYAPSSPRNRPVWLHRPKPSRPLSSLAVAWRHATMVHGSFLFFHSQNWPHLAINRWVVLSSKHSTQEPLSHTCIFLLFLVVLFRARQEASLESLYFGEFLVWIIWRFLLCSCSPIINIAMLSN